MSSLGLLLAVWALAVPIMVWGWVWQRRHENIGIVDVLWSVEMSGAAVLIAVLGPGATAPRMILGLLGGAWGARLAWHLWRRVRSGAEDGRYRSLRVRWKGHQGKIFAFFQFQALLVPLFSLPFVAVALNHQTHPIALTLALAIWSIAVAGESLADAQLWRFRANPVNRGKTCRQGLWRYSRHPNYFFEWLHWFTYVLLAIGSSWFWVAWSGPGLMYLFLRFLSGIPFTEQQALRTRGEDYRIYQRETPMLFPWIPKSHSNERRPTS